MVLMSFQMLQIPTMLVTTEEVDHVECGRIVRVARSEKAMTAKRLAELMNVSAAYVCELERGKRNWNIDLYSKALTIIQNS